jgi:endonuclease/exonuclease/phosphatase family metal-dependent hydrolase
MRHPQAEVLAVLIILLSASCGVRKTYTDPRGPVYSGNHCPAPSEFTGTLKVVSYNIALGEQTNLAMREFWEIPEIRDADIILLQEMDAAGAGAMAESLGYDYVYYPSVVHVKHGKDFGTAVLTRWCIVSHRKVLLPYEDPVRKSRRAITVAEISAGDQQAVVMSVHTETAWMNIDRRVAQADSLVRSLVGTHRYAIAGGDFNTFSWDALDILDEFFERAGFVRATEGIGSTATWGPLGLFELELDHIYTRGFEVVEAGKIWEAQASDHKPVWAILRPE